METQPTQTSEVPLTFSEKCKLVIFLVVTLSIVGYIGICLRVLLTAQYNYPSDTPCEK